MTTKQKVTWLAKLLKVGENDQRNLWLFAGIEPIAYFDQSEQKWYQKTAGCSMCGKCCHNAADESDWNDETGRCRYLKQDSKTTFICSLKFLRPFGCSVHNGQRYIKECTVRYNEV